MADLKTTMFILAVNLVDSDKKGEAKIFGQLHIWYLVWNNKLVIHGRLTELPQKIKLQLEEIQVSSGLPEEQHRQLEESTRSYAIPLELDETTERTIKRLCMTWWKGMQRVAIPKLQRQLVRIANKGLTEEEFSKIVDTYDKY